MKDLSRREFIHAVTGVAVGSTVAGHDAFLHGAPLAGYRTAVGQSSAPCDGACLPLQSAIFPQPQEISTSDSDFALDNQVRVVVPQKASEEDLFLAASLVNELSDRFGLHLKIERAADLSAGRRVILMGSMENPWVRRYCTENKLMASAEALGPESYILRTDNNTVLVAGEERSRRVLWIAVAAAITGQGREGSAISRSADSRLARQAVSRHLHVPSRTRQHTVF